MKVILAILLVIAFFLLFVGRREGFNGDCGNLGIASLVIKAIRVYTLEECTALGGRFYDDNVSAGVPGYGLCTRQNSTYLGDISTGCGYLNTEPSTDVPSPTGPVGPAPPPSLTGSTGPAPPPSLTGSTGPSLTTGSLPPAPTVTSLTAPLPDAMPTSTGGNTLTSLPIPTIPAPQAASVMTSTPVGAPLGSGMPHGILLTIV